jgi:hypothetical protein
MLERPNRNANYLNGRLRFNGQLATLTTQDETLQEKVVDV